MSEINQRNYVRIVPESTGDRIQFYHTYDIEYDTKTGAFPVGETVTGGASGLQGIILKDTPDHNITNTGVLSISLLTSFEDYDVTAGEDLLVNTISQAKAAIGYCIYVNTSTLVGGNNANYKQYVDNEGQAYVRFAEGSPQFDAFGKLQTSDQTTLGEYIFQYDEHPEDFSDLITGGSSIAHDNVISGVVLTNTTASGDKIERLSHQYFKYNAGKSHLIELTCAIGDTGKENVDRAWGYGDNNDGLFFLLEGTTMSVMKKNSTSGSIVTSKVTQSSWNGDRLDGSGTIHNISGHTLDVSKDNYYWIDFQWLGAGRVRFGVVIDGIRIICHEMYNANNNSLPFMRTGTLPLCVVQENTGIAGSTSEMRVFCMVVKSEGKYESPHNHFSGNLQGVTITGTEIPLMTFRSKQTFKAIDNRISSYGTSVDIFSSTEPVLIELVRNATLTSATWAGSVSVDSSIEFDTVSSTVTGGTVIKSIIVAGNDVKTMGLRDIFKPNAERMSRNADITGFSAYSFRASLLNGTTTNVTLTANWEEVL